MMPRVVGTHEPHHIPFVVLKGIPKVMEVLIRGTNPFDMEVVDANTGELMKHVMRVELDIRAKEVMAKLHIRNPKIEIKADAEIVEYEPRIEE